MNNYQPVILNYDCKSIIDITDIEDDSMCKSYSIQEIAQLRRLLKFPYIVKSVLFFSIAPHSSSPIHKDLDLNNPDINSTFALNLPLVNCNKTYMKWFNAVEGAAELFLPGPSNNARSPKLNVEDSECIDEANSNSPLLVSINNWHSVENRDDFVSKLISIRFFKSASADTLTQYLNKPKIKS